MTGLNAMRCDLAKRIGELERVAGPVDDPRRGIPITPEMRAAICVEPDDGAAFDRLLSGDKSAIHDLSTPALRAIRDSYDEGAECQT